ncbi:MAG TPA: Clp protease N-terminal domain-containing protein [Chloroflexota bacterium]|nr:Clp protease N-terminal domain-containing protein [Chloroflexota bacterium]
MTAKKDLKRLVRDRGRKTGESYTAALRHFRQGEEPPVQPEQGTAFPDRFSKFSEAARRAMAYAQDEAHRRSHNFLGSEHLLLALTWQPTSAAGRLLHSLAGPQSRVRLREAIDAQLLAAPPPTDEVGLTTRLRTAFELAVEAARAHGQDFVGTAHLLFGLIHEPSGFATLALSCVANDLPSLLSAIESALPSGDNAASIPLNATYRELAARFTPDAKQALMYATEEAIRLQQNYVGTEHQLLGLVRVPMSSAGLALTHLGVDLQRVRRAVELIVNTGDRHVTGELPLTPRAEKVVQLAAAAANQLGHPLIDTSHLLLGLAEEGSGIAAGVLESLGLSMDAIRGVVELELAGPSGSWRPVTGARRGAAYFRRISAMAGQAPEPSLGGLQRVIAVGQARSGLALLSVELYQDGFLAILRLVAAPASAPFPELVVAARDDAGHTYIGLLVNRNASLAPATQEWRATYAFAALAPEARQLTFSVRASSTNPPGAMPARARPWAFKVSVAPPGRRGKRAAAG